MRKKHPKQEFRAGSPPNFTPCAEFCMKVTTKQDLNSPVLQFGAPPAIDSGEAKIRTASWENVDKHGLRNTKLHLSVFQMT